MLFEYAKTHRLARRGVQQWLYVFQNVVVHLMMLFLTAKLSETSSHQATTWCCGVSTFPSLFASASFYVLDMEAHGQMLWWGVTQMAFCLVPNTVLYLCD